MSRYVASLNAILLRLARRRKVDVVEELVSAMSLFCADINVKKKKTDSYLSTKISEVLKDRGKVKEAEAHGKSQLDFRQYHWLKDFDENKPQWPLVLHAVYFQIIEKQDTEQLLNDKAEAFLCEGTGMGTLCKFGDFMGRVYGAPMVAVNFYKDMESNELWSLVNPILERANKDNQAVTVFTSNKPEYFHKYITKYESKGNIRDSMVTYYNSAGVESYKNVDDQEVLASKAGPCDSTFFMVPLTRFPGYAAPGPRPEDEAQTRQSSTSE